LWYRKDESNFRGKVTVAVFENDVKLRRSLCNIQYGHKVLLGQTNER